MASIVWTREARERLREIHEYIARDNSTAALAVVEGIYAKTQLLRQHPRMGQRYELIVDREIREIIFGHYRIPYLIVDESRIEIIGGAMDIEQYLK
jgi:toxin ParE1/3/4